MQTEAARNLIKETFERPFNKQQFTVFIKNLLNHIEETPFTYRGNLIFDDFKDRVESLERIGKYTDKEGKKADILIVHLKRANSLDRARTAQRQFVAKYLKGSRGGELKDAALVAFVSPDEEDWRFSYVKMEYKYDQEGHKIIEEFTPARRYSFLVGKNEKSHTAQSQLLSILENTDKNPTLKDIEGRFNVETVTKEFFEKYRELFLGIKEALDALVKKDKDIKADFESKGVETVDFAKKLLGQIVFLYFLQKKGWFGVARNATWGTGPKNFLRLLSERKLADYDNFFNEILEPLFYEALASEREADYYSKFKCKVPFLNGGLFDPLNNYDWVHTDVCLPNELFSNSVKNKKGDIGTGILDVFDLYNFTVKEDEPLEKEVAVDPEMLGKVFENLLEVKDRKSKGTYYTPREIVHYMCQESLINYLANELDGNVNHNDIETLVKHGETAVDNDIQVLGKGKETSRYSFKLPDSVRDHADLIDRMLADVKVCDPAVGSGAFLVGMMTEIIRTRSVLTEFIDKSDSRSAYDIKRHAIQNSLYGVDIDPGAVEIAKLRLWLSMIVDEDDYRQIKPLPNLDYKIMQGNSLLEEYEGIKLIDERFFVKTEDKAATRKNLLSSQKDLQSEYFELHSTRKLTRAKEFELKKRLDEIKKQLTSLDNPNGNGQDTLSIFEKTDAQAKAEKLLNLHEAFFAAYHKREKDKLKEQIDKLTWDLIEATLRHEKKSDKLEELRRFQKTNTRPFFLWNLNFAEIFQNKGGFDVVIANPPYVRHETIKDFKPQFKKEFCGFYCGTADLYTYFYKKGINLLRESGHLCFISPNKFMRAGYGKKTRALLSTEVTPKSIIDFRDLPIFDATTYPAVLLVEKKKPYDNDSAFAATFNDFSQVERLEETLSIVGFHMPVAFLKGEGWSLERPQVLALMDKLANVGVPFREYIHGCFYYGIKTGLNEAFVVDSKTRDSIIKKGRNSSVVFKPWLRGRDIKKWKSDWANLYLINIPSSSNHNWPWSAEVSEAKARKIFKETYPSIHNHLSQWEKELRSRDDQGKFWWELRSCVYNEEFERPKIIYPDIAKAPEFTWDEKKLYLGNTAYIIPTDEDWLLGFLNSKLLWWYYVNISSTIRGGFVRFIAQYIERLPIPDISDEQKNSIAKIVRKILADPRGSNVNKYEGDIDRIVYGLYALTPEEIAVVEGKQ